jgi:hypothetical protein
VRRRFFFQGSFGFGFGLFRFVLASVGLGSFLVWGAQQQGLCSTLDQGLMEMRMEMRMEMEMQK